MKITADFTRLHSGENLARRLKFTVDEEFLGKKAKIGFITPKGRIYFTGELPYKNGEGEYIIPASLLDGRGVLHCQLFVWDSSEFLGKSPITEIPVYPSVDDIDCPAIGEDTKKSLALIFEYLEQKSDKGHSHDERYYTKEHIDSVLKNVQTGGHNHDDRYYTESETDNLIAENVQQSIDFTLGVSKDILAKFKEKSDVEHVHDDRYYTEAEIEGFLEGKSDADHNHNEKYYSKADIDEKLEGVSSVGHTHDSRYYTEAEVDNLLGSKSNTSHSHDGRYYTQAAANNLLSTKADSSYVEALAGTVTSTIEDLTEQIEEKADTDHTHDSRYYTEEEVNALLAEKADVSDVGGACISTVRMPGFEDIDNTAFIPKITACAATWLEASDSGQVIYGSLGEGDNGEDLMETQINPMLYSYRSAGNFTGAYRDIYSEAKAGGQKTVNCITLCNMLAMGVPYKSSRLHCHENVIGMGGYAFDICKLLGKSIAGENREISYNPNQKLDITTFEQILTQSSFFEAYGQFGLVKTIKAQKTADGDIWYDAIRPGDVLWTGTHSLFCLSVNVDSDSGNVTIEGVHAASVNNTNISNYSFTVTEQGNINGIDYDRILKVARPYYSYVAPECSTEGAAAGSADTSYCKLLKGPFIGIAKNVDLNTLLTVGEYRCASKDNVASLEHKPTDLEDTFRLTVENLTKDTAKLSSLNDFLQTIVSSKGEIYTRIVTTYNHSVADPYFYPWRKHSMENHTVTAIKDDDDLNSFTKIGEYRCTSWERARKLKNRPSQLEHAFRMIVDNTMDDTFTMQEGKNFTQRIREVSGREYWRRIYWENGAIAFGDWHKVLTETIETTST